VSVHLSEIVQVALSVADLAEAKGFYRDVLGMTHLFDAGSVTFFQCGNVRVMLSESDKTSGKGTVLYFRIADIHETCTLLKRDGVTFAEEPHIVARMNGYDLWLAFLEDPAGNPLGLMSEVARIEAAE